MNLRKMLNQVADFHEIMRYRQPEPRIPDLADPATNKLRPSLLTEEIRETLEAIESGNRVEQLDGLCDSQYVLSGAVLAWGYRELYLATVNTMELRKIHDVSGHIAAMLGTVRMMEQAAQHLLAHQVLTHLCELQKRLNTLVWHLGFSPVFEEAFAEVHRSNCSKIWKEDELDLNAVHRYAATKGGYIGYRADGKIIKSPSYLPAQLERFV